MYSPWLLVSLVLKGLGTNRELAALDRKICSGVHNNSSSDDSCQAKDTLQQLLQAWVVSKNDLQG